MTENPGSFIGKLNLDDREERKTLRIEAGVDAGALRIPIAVFYVSNGKDGSTGYAVDPSGRIYATSRSKDLNMAELLLQFVPNSSILTPREEDLPSNEKRKEVKEKKKSNVNNSPEAMDEKFRLENIIRPTLGLPKLELEPPPPGAGLEEPTPFIAARKALFDYANNRDIHGVLEVLIEPGRVRDVSNDLSQFSGLVKEAGYKEGRALLISSAPPAEEILKGTIRIYIQNRPGWRDAVKGNLQKIPWQVEYVENPIQADLLIGDEGLRIDPSRQALLQVDPEGKAIPYVTPALLLHLQKENLLIPGTILYVGLLVKGDLGEAVLIFA
ncbi:MAG: hypothetical protein HYZ90_03880 [Candidatus Omnitrophica bacterium]|nr:hypothetical protein [Candidatus Omnitrophota bacterium]